MAVADVPLLSMLKSRLHWHQTRQKLLAENVANADTPGFRPRDLREPTFGAGRAPGETGVALQVTAPLHLAGFSPERPGESVGAAQGFEIAPSGNGVSLEDEMMKSAQNQSDFQLAASLYQKSLKMLTMAIGKGG